MLRLLAIPLCLSLVSAINTNDSTSEQVHTPQHRRTIVGGAPAAVGAYPSFGVYGDFRRNRENLCGGVLIHSDIFITAAHCFFGRDREILGRPIYLGANKLDRSDANEVINVVALQRHPEFRPNFGPQHDLMLLKLERPSQAPVFRIGSDLQRPADNEELIVLGFGGDDRTSASSTLMQASVDAVNFDSCNQVFGGGLGRNAQICAGGSNSDSCSNDSGGPLLGLDGSLFGIVSFGVECGGPVPAIYARVNTAALFIQSFICEESSNPPPVCFGPALGSNPSPFLGNPFPATNPVPSPVATPVIAWAISPTWVSITSPTAPTPPVFTVSPPPPPAAAPTPGWTFILPQPTSPATPSISPIFLAAGNPSGSTPVIPIQWGTPAITPPKPTANFALPAAGGPSFWTAASSPTWASSFARESVVGEASKSGADRCRLFTLWSIWPLSGALLFLQYL